MTTIKPVWIRYDEEVDGYLPGSVYEVPSPEQAWAAHPNATITRYADGTNYNDRAAKKEVRERDTVASDEDTTVKRSKGSVTRSRTRKGQEDPTVTNVLPAAPDASTAMFDGDEVDEDGNPVSIEAVDVPENEG